MKKKLFLFAVLACYALMCTAQTSRRSVTFSWGMLRETWPATGLAGATAPSSLFSAPSEGQLVVDADLWNIGKNFSLGFYAGVARSSFKDDGLIEPSVLVRYGIAGRYHLIPESERWDVSLKGVLGSMWCYGTTLQADYGAGLSASFYMSKHWGITAEYLVGRFVFSDYDIVRIFTSNHFLKCGISFRW